MTQQNVPEIVSLLRTIASEPRFDLLSKLRSPRTLDELLVTPGPGREGERPDRPITRQAVQRHLDLLIEAGLVKKTSLGERHAFVLDHSRLFSLQEELRGAASHASTFDTAQTETVPIAPPRALRWPPGRKLIEVHGADPGRAYALDPSTLAGGRAWTIGRAREASVRLDADPYASSASAEVIPDGEKAYLVTVGRNPVTLDWQPLAPGRPQVLLEGALIGVGRTLLLHRTR